MKKSFKLAALFVAAAISVAVVSCNKDKETEEPVASQSQNSEAKELLNRIYTFQELRDDINSGAKSGESMTLEELRDNIDLTFNFEHSQHATPFANATLDTFYVRMPQTDANGNVSAADAIATYNAFETSLENLLANVEDETNLAKNFSIKFPETGTKNEDAIQVVFTRGERNLYPSDGGPFVKGDDFYWGGLLGNYGPTQNASKTDAANELTKKFQHVHDENTFSKIYDVEYVGYKCYEDPQNLFYKHIYFEDPSSSEYWLFCFIGDCDIDPWIGYNDMNRYWRKINALVVSPNGALYWGPTSGSPYYECVVEDVWAAAKDIDKCIKAHVLNITYCKSF